MMAPLQMSSILHDNAKRATLIAAPHVARLATRDVLLKRSLSVNHTQQVTLGIIVAYTVVIALLWNLPYVRWSLWPFKVVPSSD